MSKKLKNFQKLVNKLRLRCGVCNTPQVNSSPCMRRHNTKIEYENIRTRQREISTPYLGIHCGTLQQKNVGICDKLILTHIKITHFSVNADN